MRLGDVLLGVVLVASSPACATCREQLAASERAVEADDHPRAAALLRDLEPDLGRFSPSERAEYAYLRGLASHRLGARSDATYWLAMARAYDDIAPGSLPAAWKTRVERLLAELTSPPAGHSGARPSGGSSG